MKAKELLEKMNACNEAIKWVEDRTIEQAWQECERGDWMLWFYAKQYPEKVIELTLADKLSIKAVAAAIDFGNGLISDVELKLAVYYAARKENQKLTADICRKYLTLEDK